jgi:hypothetical protein
MILLFKVLDSELIVSYYYRFYFFAELNDISIFVISWDFVIKKIGSRFISSLMRKLMQLAEDSVQRQALLNTARNIAVPLKA